MNRLEIWGRAQHEVARCCKSDWVILGPQVLIRKAVNYKCGKMTLRPKPHNKTR